MKTKLLPVLLVVLILLNGVLIFMLIKKPLQNKRSRPERNFLTAQLQFSEDQEVRFLELDELHKQKIEVFLHQIGQQKDKLFNSFNDDEINIDSLVNLTGKLEVAKELEVYRFFKAVRKICNKEQQKKFDNIINKALKRDGQRPPRREENHHPPREGGMPPPPPR